MPYIKNGIGKWGIRKAYFGEFYGYRELGIEGVQSRVLGWMVTLDGKNVKWFPYKYQARNYIRMRKREIAQLAR
jgi:hypothetical protein